MTTVWLVAILSLTLPNEYRPRSNTTQSFPLAGPPGMTSSEEFRSWVAPGGKELYLFYWTPYPRDLGPMAVASEFPARVAGQDTKIIETSMFMGRKQRVLVVHLGFEDQKAGAMIYAVGVDRREFESILAGIKRVEKKARAQPFRRQLSRSAAVGASAAARRAGRYNDTAAMTKKTRPMMT